MKLQILLLLAVLIGASVSPISAQEKALTMTMTPGKSTYKSGELPEFTVTVTNRSQQTQKFCRYRLDYRLKAAMIADGGQGGQDFEAQPFVSQKWTPLSSEDIVALAPGESLSHTVSFEADPIFGWLRRAKQPPVVPKSNAVDGFPSGTFEFNTALSNQVGLYVGKDGVFDHRLEVRKVPNVWPGGHDDCFIQLVEATAKVTFE